MASTGSTLRLRTPTLIIGILLIMLITAPVSARVTVTTLAQRTIPVTGTWEKNNASRIPFTVSDFQGFRFINLSYEMLNPVTVNTANACGLVFKLTTADSLASTRNGSNLVYVLLGEGDRFFNTGSISFDPRANPGQFWQTGPYWILVNMKPENCVNEVHVRLDLYRDTGSVTEPATPQPLAVTTPMTTGETPTVPAAKEPASTPVAAQQAPGSGTPVPSPTKPPLPVYLPCLGVMLAILIFGVRLTRR